MIARPGEAPAGQPTGWRVADDAGQWLAAEMPSAGILYNQDIAGLINDAADKGIITGGPDGAAVAADCIADREGVPDGWRILIRLPGLDCCQVSDPCQALEDIPGGMDLLQGAVAEANALLAVAHRAGFAA